jgi:hypothetical protein
MSPYASNRSKPTLHEWSRSLWGTRALWTCIPSLTVAAVPGVTVNATPARNALEPLGASDLPFLHATPSSPKAQQDHA